MERVLLERVVTTLELQALELPRAWAVVWALTLLGQRVLLVRECLVGSPAFVVMLDATRAAARFGAEVPLVVMVQRVWAMV